jgi:phosphosulfolactate synthase (CoM biosynthesis protein A)
MTAERRFFDFLELAPRSSKPRERGLTVIGDEGDPIDWLRGMLEGWGEYIDYVKFVPAMLMMPSRLIEERIKLYRDFRMNVALDDPIFAIAYYEGKAEKLLHSARDLGFTHCQIDTGHVKLGDSQKVKDDDEKFTAIARELGFKFWGEVGQKHSEGDPARAKGGLLNVSVIIDEMKRLLASGCEHVFLESRVMREAIGDFGEKEEGDAQLCQIVEAVGQDNVMIEITNQLSFDARQCHRLWSVRKFGPDVNIGGGASIKELRFIEAIRRGITFVPGPSKSSSRLWVRSLAKNKGTAADDWWKSEEYNVDPNLIGQLK